MKSTNPSKRIKTLGLHEWTDNELIINFYVAKYGLKNLDVCFNSVEDLCKHLGVGESSFKMQESNFRMLLKCHTGVLTDFSKAQKLVYDLFHGESMYKFYLIVKDILNIDRMVRDREMRKRQVRILA